jgi:hypothetical protein
MLSWRVVIALATAGCVVFTEPTSVAVDFEIVQVGGEEERRTWPSPGVVEGDHLVLVRGWAALSCVPPKVTAEQRDRLITLRITSIPAHCIATVPLWQPYRATFRGLSPGNYLVRVSASGQPEPFQGMATVEP